MGFEDILAPVVRYYTETVEAHGPTSRGADWSSDESQRLRFEQLLKVCPSTGPFSILDYGCGYAALVDHLLAGGYQFQYRGFDLAPAMLRHARARQGGRPDCLFFERESDLPVSDYAVASGTFNVKLETDTVAWREYVIHCLDVLQEKSRRGFAFNMLTGHSDPERRKEHLYYASPGFFLDHCLRQYSRKAALLHDYPLFEFTLLVRK